MNQLLINKLLSVTMFIIIIISVKEQTKRHDLVEFKPNIFNVIPRAFKLMGVLFKMVNTFIRMIPQINYFTKRGMDFGKNVIDKLQYCYKISWPENKKNGKYIYNSIQILKSKTESLLDNLALVIKRNPSKNIKKMKKMMAYMKDDNTYDQHLNNINVKNVSYNPYKYYHKIERFWFLYKRFIIITLKMWLDYLTKVKQVLEEFERYRTWILEEAILIKPKVKKSSDVSYKCANVVQLIKEAMIRDKDKNNLNKIKPKIMRMIELITGEDGLIDKILDFVA